MVDLPVDVTSSPFAFQSLRAAAPVVLPSLLLCDFGNLQAEVEALEAAGVQGLHLDVMDGRFVPNISYGLPIVEAFRGLTDLPLDAHLMIAEPQRYLRQFADAGSDIITIHHEAVADARPVLQEIRDLGKSAGLAINPPTEVAEIEPYFDLCDMILVMSVMPGFGGQSFDESALAKLRQLRELLGPDFLLEVDGGVNADTIAACTAAGADALVVGSAIFRTPDYRESLAQLNALAAGASSSTGN